MSLLRRVWRSLTGQSSDPDVLSGLWLPSNDVKMAVARLRQSREQLGQSTQKQRDAVLELEHAIHDIKESKHMPPAVPGIGAEKKERNGD